MFNIKTLIYLIIMVAITLFIIIARPDMPKQSVMTGPEENSIAEVTMPTAEIQASNTPVNVSTTPSQSQGITTSNQGGTQVGINPINYGNQTKKQSNPTPLFGRKTVQPKTIQQPQAKPNKQNAGRTITQPQTKKPQVTKPPQAQTQQQPKQVRMSQRNPVSNSGTHVLTEQEEIIAWNRWRSRLQNQVMRDTKIAAPLGTQFKFSFTVDKFGNMSNVKVWSTTPAYTSMAVRAIKPVLMSYRNQPILDFPQGTKRVITNVNGGFVISRRTEYSTPADYHDYERVRR